MRQKLLSLLLTLALVVSVLSPAASAASFSDVPQSYWAYTDIMAMQAQGLIQGSGGKFRPNESISCQAFLSMVCRAAGLDDRSLETGASWADPAMAYGYYLGWFEEDELNQSNQTKPITREFAAKLLVEALFSDETSEGSWLPAFSDEASISRDRLSYVRTAAKLGLISGYQDGRFDPQGTLTRAAAAALLHRALQLRDSASSGASVQVPILMYHDVSYLGYGYSKTPEVFRQQMQELKDAGFHTVFYSQLIDYVTNGTPLPDKPIVISIDDGYQTNYTYVYPILQELDMKAEISLIGGAVQYASWGLKWDEVQEMVASGLVSFQAHSYLMHEDNTAQGGRLGVLKVGSESWRQYVETLGSDTNKILDLIESKTGARPVAFTYPRGKWNYMAEALVTALGCQVTVTTKNGVAAIKRGDASSLHLMDRIGMDFRNGSVLTVLKKFGYSG